MENVDGGNGLIDTRDASWLTPEKVLVLLGFSALVCYCFVDVVRHGYKGSPYLLLVVDLHVVAMTIVAIYSLMLRVEVVPPGRAGMSERLLGVCREVQRTIPPVIFFALAALGVYILVRFAFSFGAGFRLPVILALRTYFMPVGMLFVGMALARCEWCARKYSRILFVLLLCLVVGSIVLAMIQYWVLTHRVVDTCGNDGHYLNKWGNPLYPAFSNFKHYGESKIYLTSGPFASSKRFGHFLLFACSVLWGMSFSWIRRSWPVFAVIGVIGGFGTFLTGARESFILCVAGFTVIAAARFIRSARIWNMALAVCSILMIVVFGLLTKVTGPEPMAHVRGRHSRLVSLFSDRMDYLCRLYIAVPVAFLRSDAPSPVFGEGLGTYGQEVRIEKGSDERIRAANVRRFRPSPAGRVELFGDAGMTRIIVELGLAGLALFAVLGVAVLVQLWLVFLKSVECGDAINVALLLSLAAIFIFAVKAHATLSEMGVMGYGWMIYAVVTTRYGRMTKV